MAIPRVWIMLLVPGVCVCCSPALSVDAEERLNGVAEQQPHFCSPLQSVHQLWEGGEQMPQVVFLQVLRLGWDCCSNTG